MNQQPDIFDEYEKEVEQIIYLVRRLQNQDAAAYIGKNLPGNNPRLDAVALTLAQKDVRTFQELLDSMKRIEKHENIRPGALYPPR